MDSRNRRVQTPYSLARQKKSSPFSSPTFLPPTYNQPLLAHTSNYGLHTSPNTQPFVLSLKHVMDWVKDGTLSNDVAEDCCQNRV